MCKFLFDCKLLAIPGHAEKCVPVPPRSSHLRGRTGEVQPGKGSVISFPLFFLQPSRLPPPLDTPPPPRGPASTCFPANAFFLPVRSTHRGVPLQQTKLLGQYSGGPARTISQILDRSNKAPTPFSTASTLPAKTVLLVLLCSTWNFPGIQASTVLVVCFHSGCKGIFHIGKDPKGTGNRTIKGNDGESVSSKKNAQVFLIHLDGVPKDKKICMCFVFWGV